MINLKIIQALEPLNIPIYWMNYDGNDEEILSLARRLLATEEHNREEFKTYL